ncbi:MAG: DMT family transporter [Deltaproteobacteria bacterium]|nr:DMT family transporter [Deltaproteobacteria bacterium]
MALLSVAFGANVVAIRIAVVSFGPLTLAGLRFLVGGLIVAAWARAAGEPLALSGARLRRALVFSVVFAVQLGLFYLGMQRTLASRGSLIGNVQPFVVLLLAHFLLPGERITVRRVVGVLLGFAGVLTLFLDQETTTAAVRSGDFIVLAAVIVWAGTTVWLKRIIDDYSSFQLSFYPMAVTAVLLLSAGVVWDQPMVGDVTGAALGALGYQAGIAGVGFVAWNAVFRRYGAVAINSFLFLQPIAGVGLGAALLGEPFASHGVLVGLPLVVLGIAIVNLGGGAANRVATTSSGWGGGIRTPD